MLRVPAVLRRSRQFTTAAAPTSTSNILRTTHATTKILNAIVQGSTDAAKHRPSATLSSYSTTLDATARLEPRFQPAPLIVLEPVAYLFGQLMGQLGQSQILLDLASDASYYVATDGLRQSQQLNPQEQEAVQPLKQTMKQHRDAVHEIPDHLQTASASIGQVLINLSKIGT